MDVGAVARAQTEFVVNLFKAVASKDEASNAVLSPVSISLALAMVAAGAKGATLEQMASCLKLPHEGDAMHQFASHLKGVLAADAAHHGLQLLCANSLWVDQGIQLHASFQSLLRHSYGAEAAPVDFQHKAEEARETVNKWAEDATNGKIANVLPDGAVSSDTKMILANAIYFKGAWKKPFHETSTEELDFFLPDGKSIKVATMQTMKDQYVRSFPTFKALRLPYKFDDDETRSFAMYVLLPHERDGLREMEESLTADALQGLDAVRHKVPMLRFQLPKFKISFGLEMSETLKAMGMVLPFQRGGADLSNISPTPLRVDSVRHKAFVEVNETGTEAGAVTTVEIMLMSMPMYTDDSVFVADHPFVFVIMEESSNTVLFTGRVLDPSKP